MPATHLLLRWQIGIDYTTPDANKCAVSALLREAA